VFRQVLADAIVIAIQRLYLLEEDDEPTGTLALDDVMRFNPEL
jgi:N-acetylmuramoyl-L-alanine amidase